MKTIRNRLLETRLNLGLTQKELGKLTLINPTAISHFESGRRYPCIRNLKKLCVAMRVSSDYILGIKD